MSTRSDKDRRKRVAQKFLNQPGHAARARELSQALHKIAEPWQQLRIITRMLFPAGIASSLILFGIQGFSNVSMLVGGLTFVAFLLYTMARMPPVQRKVEALMLNETDRLIYTALRETQPWLEILPMALPAPFRVPPGI